MDDILDRARERGEDPFIVVLDGLEDPHNLDVYKRQVIPHYVLHAYREEQGLCPHVKNPAFHANVIKLRKDVYKRQE